MAAVELLACKHDDSPAPFYDPSAVVDAGSDAQAAQADAGTMPSTDLPKTTPPTPATISAPALGEPKCLELAGIEARAPVLFARGSKLHAFWYESLDGAAPLLTRVVDANKLTASDPMPVAYGARTIDLAEPAGKTMLALVGRQYYALIMESSDGLTWIEKQKIGPDEPTYLCSEFPPLRFFRGASDPSHPTELVMGNQFNDGLFGCHSRLFHARETDGKWSVPVKIGDGDATFAVQSDGRSILVASSGVWTSDDASTFTQLAGGPPGGSAAWTGNTLWIAYASTIDTGNAVLLRATRDGARTFEPPLSLQYTPEIVLPQLVANGEHLALAMQASASVGISQSIDGGKTWSEPVKHENQGVSALAVLDTGVAWLSLSPKLELCVAQ
jgi:hypothetical protein